MKQRFVGFQGEIPRIAARLLPESAAQNCRNARLEDGALVPLNESKVVETLAVPVDPIVTIYRRYDGTWLTWDVEVNATGGPVTDSDRTYYTGDGVPKVIYGAGAGTVHSLAVPPPSAGLTIAVSSGALDPDTSEAVFYAYTYVTQWGEESQPSDLSNELACSPLQIISVTGFVNPAARGITLYRLYRSQTDSLGETTLFFVAEITIATFVSPYLHNMVNDPLENSIPSLDWTVPIDTLVGLCAGPNGMMAAFKGKDLYFCEPYIPHAWPVKYMLSMDYKIVGLAAIGSAFVVLTEGTPYIVQGTNPGSMVPTEMEQNLPCLASRSIVDLGYSVVYASTEGLVKITNAGAELLTGTMFTTRQWQNQRASTIIASQHFGAYIYTHDNEDATGRLGVIIDLTGKQPFLVRHDEDFTATFFAIGEGSLYILINDNEIALWDSPDTARRDVRWVSRLIHLPSPVNFGCYLMETEAGEGTTATIKVYADGVLKHTGTTQNAVARLPSGFLALKWEVEFIGTTKVTSLNLATSPSELAVT